MNKIRTETHKKCAGCNETKELAEFYSTIRKSGGIWYSGRCKPCHLAHCKEFRSSEYGKEVYRAWAQTESGKACILKRMEKWRSKEPHKRKAHTAISNALRDGRIKKKPCRICNNAKSEAHHISYDNPYDVDWLCKACHVKIHYP